MVRQELDVAVDIVLIFGFLVLIAFPIRTFAFKMKLNSDEAFFLGLLDEEPFVRFGFVPQEVTDLLVLANLRIVEFVVNI